MGEPLPNAVTPQTDVAGVQSSGSRPPSRPPHYPPPHVPDYELLRVIGGGSYGEVWLARNILGEDRAVKMVYRRTFEKDRPFDREFEGIKRFEPISRSHPSQVAVLHVGRNDAAGFYYYIMELADDGTESRLQPENATERPGPRP